MNFLKNISQSTATDEQLVDAYKKSANKELLASLYQRYMDLVFGVCIKYLKDTEEARDATMNIFGELVEKLMKYEVSSFRPWLYAVARNHCLMHIRSASKMRTIQVDPELMQSAEETHLNGIFEKESTLNQLSTCLETLAEVQKRVIKLFYLQKKCYKEISDQTGLDWNKVRSLIQNGRRKLKICMENQSKAKDHHE